MCQIINVNYTNKIHNVRIYICQLSTAKILFSFLSAAYYLINKDRNLKSPQTCHSMRCSNKDRNKRDVMNVGGASAQFGSHARNRQRWCVRYT